METIKAQYDWAMAFLAVVDAGSFSRGAEHAGCSKAYISKQVAQLEAALQVQLLFRTTRRLALTEAGRSYLEHCRALRSIMVQAEETVAGLRDEVAGLIRLTAPTTFGEAFLGDMLQGFSQRYPKVEIDIDLSLAMRDLMAEGFDVALRSSAALDERLVARPVGVRRDWLMASPAAIAQYGLPQTPQELAGLPCLLNSHLPGNERWLLMREQQVCEVPVRRRFSANSYPMLRRLALAGAGFACLPRHLVEADMASGRLQRVLPDYELPSFPIYLVYPYRQTQPRKLRALIDHIHDWFAAPEQAARPW
ncbi:LysR family transcriptional regulator [Chitinimonas sp.]|uniref:LysR family transcriptional regulator n=1 Tax=Chitinimonas sp. TaxID=1934313 RepID=UPI0035AFB6FC